MYVYTNLYKYTKYYTKIQIIQNIQVYTKYTKIYTNYTKVKI